MISQNLQLAQHQRLNAYMHRSLGMLYMNSLNLYQEISQFAQENPSLILPDDWHDWPQTYRRRKYWAPSSAPFISPIEYTPGKNSLQQHLLFQWQYECQNETEYAIGEKIISNLDSNGFHKISPRDLFSGQMSQQGYQSVLKKIQVLDPVGCATDDCFESLLIQMRQDGLGLSLSAENVKNALSAWSAHDKEKARVLFQCQNMDKLEKLMLYMRDYTPYPGAAFQGYQNISYIIPEFFVQLKEGKLILKESLPLAKNLKIDDAYEELSQEKNAQGRQARQLIARTKEFLKMLEERESTLRRIVSLVCTYQKDFFSQGPQAIKPLRQKDIARQIHIHEATVSRAVRAKYLDTPAGIIPLSALFSRSSLPHHTHGSISKTAIKAMIQNYLNDKKNRPSDQKICDKLNEQGYKIARRTVTKYRNELEKS